MCSDIAQPPEVGFEYALRKRWFDILEEEKIRCDDEDYGIIPISTSKWRHLPRNPSSFPLAESSRGKVLSQTHTLLRLRLPLSSLTLTPLSVIHYIHTITYRHRQINKNKQTNFYRAHYSSFNLTRAFSMA